MRSCSAILAIGLAALQASAPLAHAQSWAERLATGAFEEPRADFHDIAGPSADRLVAHTGDATVIGQSKRARVNGTELAYIELGQGEPVVLIHGFMWDYRVWEGPMAELSRKYRVIAYSRRHHWPNPEPGEDFNPSMATQAEDLAALLRTLKLGPAHLIGHSAGANIALLVAQSHPELVASLVLAEPGPALTPANAPAPPAGPPPFIVQATEAFRAGEHERGIRVIVAGVAGAEAGPAILEEYMRVFLDNVPVTKAQLTAVNRTPPPSLTCEQAAEIEAPALLMNGEASPPVFHAVAGQLLGCLRAVEPVTIPGAGHGLYLQNPAAFHEAVLAFLEEHASAEAFPD